jgi:hypothetical protein
VKRFYNEESPLNGSSNKQVLLTHYIEQEQPAKGKGAGGFKYELPRYGIRYGQLVASFSGCSQKPARFLEKPTSEQGIEPRRGSGKVSDDYPTGPQQAGNLKNHRILKLEALPRYITKASPLIFGGKVGFFGSDSLGLDAGSRRG